MSTKKTSKSKPAKQAPAWRDEDFRVASTTPTPPVADWWEPELPNPFMSM
jgi:hypothetical protein